MHDVQSLTVSWGKTVAPTRHHGKISSSFHDR